MVFWIQWLTALWWPCWTVRKSARMRRSASIGPICTISYWAIISMRIPLLEFVTYRPDTKTCQLKKEGAADERKFHPPTVSYPRPTSGPKFCQEPGITYYFNVLSYWELFINPSDKPTEPLFARHLVVGGDDMNQHLWMSDSSGKTWRKSIRLPYGDNATSYGATLLQRKDKEHNLRECYLIVDNCITFSGLPNGRACWLRLLRFLPFHHGLWKLICFQMAQRQQRMGTKFTSWRRTAISRMSAGTRPRG